MEVERYKMIFTKIKKELKNKINYLFIEQKVKDAPKRYLAELDKHPEGFSFVKYGWSLTFCAVSRYIYEKEPMVDVDPEKNEGYEDMVFPLLLHYKYPRYEFKTSHLFKFVQNTEKYKKDHKSTWMVKGLEYNEIQLKTEVYTKNFKEGFFDIEKIKQEINAQWATRRKNPEHTADGRDNCFLYF